MRGANMKSFHPSHSSSIVAASRNVSNAVRKAVRSSPLSWRGGVWRVYTRWLRSSLSCSGRRVPRWLRSVGDEAGCAGTGSGTASASSSWACAAAHAGSPRRQRPRPFPRAPRPRRPRPFGFPPFAAAAAMTPSSASGVSAKLPAATSGAAAARVSACMRNAMSCASVAVASPPNASSNADCAAADRYPSSSIHAATAAPRLSGAAWGNAASSATRTSSRGESCSCASLASSWATACIWRARVRGSTGHESRNARTTSSQRWPMRASWLHAR